MPSNNSSGSSGLHPVGRTCRTQDRDVERHLTDLWASSKLVDCHWHECPGSGKLCHSASECNTRVGKSLSWPQVDLLGLCSVTQIKISRREAWATLLAKRSCWRKDFFVPSQPTRSIVVTSSSWRCGLFLELFSICCTEYGTWNSPSALSTDDVLCLSWTWVCALTGRRQFVAVSQHLDVGCLSAGVSHQGAEITSSLVCKAKDHQGSRRVKLTLPDKRGKFSELSYSTVVCSVVQYNNNCKPISWFDSGRCVLCVHSSCLSSRGWEWSS